MTYDVFISYSRKDSEIAGKIHKALDEAGISCFIDLEGISGGADFPAVLSEAIMGAKVLLFVASKNSYASEFTQKEITFAVSKKGSSFIFPLIVDGSTLPQNLEFLLSNINWRILSSSYRIEKHLVDDIKAKLANPHAGETLAQQDSRKAFTAMIIFIAVVVLGVGGYFGFHKYQQYSYQKARAAATAKTQAAKEECTEAISLAEAEIAKVDSLKALNQPRATFNEELERLQNADAMIARADSVIAAHRQDADFAKIFSGIGTDAVSEAAVQRRHAMFSIWRGYAVSNFNNYLEEPSAAFRRITLEYVDMALSIEPGDQQLLKIKNRLQ